MKRQGNNSNEQDRGKRQKQTIRRQTHRRQGKHIRDTQRGKHTQKNILRQTNYKRWTDVVYFDQLSSAPESWSNYQLLYANQY